MSTHRNELPAVVLITGTDTDIGKTVATAALAAALDAGGRTVAVYKPTQAGTVEGQGDVDVVRRLSGIDDVSEGIRLAHPMAPVAAATRANVTLPPIEHHVDAVLRLAQTHDHVLVEGAGGLLVALDHQGHTLADIALALTVGCGALVVCRSGLGTLNHTELTLEALERRGVPTVGVVLGSWPPEPTEVERSNRDYLGGHRVPLVGVIPAGAGAFDPADFAAAARGWFARISLTWPRQ